MASRRVSPPRQQLRRGQNLARQAAAALAAAADESAEIPVPRGAHPATFGPQVVDAIAQACQAGPVVVVITPADPADHGPHRGRRS